MTTVIQRKSKPLPELSMRDVAFDAASMGTQELGPLDKIKEMIPGESTAIYLGGLGVIPQDQAVAAVVWALIGLVITLIIKAQQIDPRTGDQMSVYALGGGPFAALGLYVPWVATLLVLGYTYAMPQMLGFLDRILR